MAKKKAKRKYISTTEIDDNNWEEEVTSYLQGTKWRHRFGKYFTSADGGERYVVTDTTYTARVGKRERITYDISTGKPFVGQLWQMILLGGIEGSEKGKI